MEYNWFRGLRYWEIKVKLECPNVFLLETKEVQKIERSKGIGDIVSLVID